MVGRVFFHHLLRDLAHEVDAGRLTDIEAAGRVAEAIQKTLQCRHVTFWSVSGEVGARRMRSIAAYDGVTNRQVAGKAEFPEAGGGFFGRVLEDGFYLCGDSFADPALAGVRDTMLVPFGIRALLAASYGDSGRVWGLITCTNDTVRRWTSAEISALRKCAAEISALRARRHVLGEVLLSGSRPSPGP